MICGVPGVVTQIHTATSTAGQPIPIPLGQSIAITLNGTTAYVPNPEDGTVIPIRTATSTAGPPITVGNGPLRIAVTPDGETVYVVNLDDATVTRSGPPPAPPGHRSPSGSARLPSPSPDQATGRHGKQTGFRE